MKVRRASVALSKDERQQGRSKSLRTSLPKDKQASFGSGLTPIGARICFFAFLADFGVLAQDGLARKDFLKWFCQTFRAKESMNDPVTLALVFVGGAAVLFATLAT